MPGRTLYPSEQRFRYPFLTGMAGNLALAAVKLVYGFLWYSRLVLLDGLFSLMTVMVFLLAWQAEVLEKRRPDARHPYGLGKALFVSMAVVGSLGLVIAIHMLIHSVWLKGRLDMERSHVGAMLIAIVSVVANEAFYRYFAEKGKGQQNPIVAQSARFNRIDAWISAAVLLLVTLSNLGATYLERLGVATISIIVVVVAARMVYAGFAGIMDKVPTRRILDRIRSCAHSVEDVQDVARIRARYLGTLLHVYVWVAIDEDISMERADVILGNVKARLAKQIPFAGEVNVIIA